MSSQDFDEFERDEEMLEARRLKRLEMKRKRKIQQRIILAVLAVILIVVIILIVKGCSGKKEPDPVEPPQENEEEIQVPETPPAEPDTTATLAAVGDIMVYDNQIADAQQEDLTYDFSDCFSAISAYTLSPDLTVGNLELNFAGAPYSGQAKTAPYFNAPESLAMTLKNIGFDILQTANTYSIMNGIDGLNSTIKFLNEAGIDHVGTYISDPATDPNGGVVIKDVNGIRIAFIAFTKGINNMQLPSVAKYAVDLLYTDYWTNYEQVNTDAILNRIDAAKKLEPDVIIAMLHWGGEYEYEISTTQEQIANLMFKNGVDVIIGSHSHVVGPMKTMEVETVDGETKECFVAYSLGNFISSMKKDTVNTQETVILNLEFTKSGETGNTTISKIEYTPLYIVDHGEEADVRFEVLPIRKALAASNYFEEFADDMTAAVDHLKTNTASAYDSGN